MSFFAAKNISVRFGGIRAVNDVSFEVKEGEVFSLIGPNGAGKTTIFNLINSFYRLAAGSIEFKGTNLASLSPHRIASLGVARTFQNIELFEHATVLQNLLIGRHVHRRTNFLQDLVFAGRTRATELAFRDNVEKVIDFLDLQHYRDSIVAGLPYGVRKVVELARALSVGPKLLLLDEIELDLARNLPAEHRGGFDGEAVVAAGHTGEARDHFLDDEIERNGGDAEIDAAHAQGGQADDHAGQRGHQQGGEQRERKRPAGVAQDRFGIGADGEERSVADRHLPGEPGQQHQPQPDDRIHDDVFQLQQIVFADHERRRDQQHCKRGVPEALAVVLEQAQILPVLGFEQKPH